MSLKDGQQKIQNESKDQWRKYNQKEDVRERRATQYFNGSR